MSTDGDTKGAKAQEAGKGEGAQNADELKAQIKAEIEADYKAKIDKLQSVIDEKVTGKKELEDRLKSEAEKRGEYDKALELHKQELEAARAEKEALASQIAELEALKPQAERWQTYQEKRKAELLEQIPEDLRDDYKDDSMESLEKALKLANIGNNEKPGTHKGAASGKLDMSGITSLQGLTSTQRRDLLKSNPALFNQLVAKELK